jgi:hypothetical protein
MALAVSVCCLKVLLPGFVLAKGRYLSVVEALFRRPARGSLLRGAAIAVWTKVDVPAA